MNFPWRGYPVTFLRRLTATQTMMAVDYDIARAEAASVKQCGWCGKPFHYSMDLDEWVCGWCVPLVRE